MGLKASPFTQIPPVDRILVVVVGLVDIVVVVSFGWVTTDDFVVVVVVVVTVTFGWITTGEYQSHHYLW